MEKINQNIYTIAGKKLTVRLYLRWYGLRYDINAHWFGRMKLEVVMPWWSKLYGEAWYQWPMDSKVMVLMPLNWVVKAARWAWYQIRCEWRDIKVAQCGYPKWDEGAMKTWWQFWFWTE